MTGSLQCKVRTSGKEYLYVVLNYRDPVLMKYKQKWISTGLEAKGNKKKAAAMIPSLIAKWAHLEKPIISSPSDFQPEVDPNITLSDYIDKWLKHDCGHIRASTREGYEVRSRSIKAYFNHQRMTVRNLKARDVDQFFKYCLESGKKNPHTGSVTGLSVRTVREFKNILTAVLSQAMIDGIVEHNVVREVKVRGKSNRQHQEQYLFLTRSEISDFLHFLKSVDIFKKLVAICFFASYYGLRRSEILGLRWEAIDTEHQILHIRNTIVRVLDVHVEDATKTNAGMRDLQLFPTAIACLEQLRKTQIENELFFGREYNPTGKDYIFCWENGRPYDPDYISKLVIKAFHRFGRPELTLHKLRYSCCTFLFEQGWDIKRVQYWIGHADASTTLNVYAQYRRWQANNDAPDLEQASSDTMDLFV